MKQNLLRKKLDSLPVKNLDIKAIQPIQNKTPFKTKEYFRISITEKLNKTAQIKLDPIKKEDFLGKVLSERVSISKLEPPLKNFFNAKSLVKGCKRSIRKPRHLCILNESFNKDELKINYEHLYKTKAHSKNVSCIKDDSIKRNARQSRLFSLTKFPNN